MYKQPHEIYLIQLEETDVVGVLLKATTAHHHTVFSDDTMVISTDTALK